MCPRCHPARNEHIIGVLQKSLRDPLFDGWNMTSFHYVLFAVEGRNGEDAHNLAVQLIELFYTWSTTQTQLRFGFPNHSVIRNLIDTAKDLFRQCTCQMEEPNENIKTE
jgi:hypothetical protein